MKILLTDRHRSAACGPTRSISPGAGAARRRDRAGDDGRRALARAARAARALCERSRSTRAPISSSGWTTRGRRRRGRRVAAGTREQFQPGRDPSQRLRARRACRAIAPVVIVAHSCVLSWWQAVKGESAPPEWERYRDEVRRGIHERGCGDRPNAGDARRNRTPLRHSALHRVTTTAAIRLSTTSRRKSRSS